MPFLAKFVCFLQIVIFRQFWDFFRHFFKETTETEGNSVFCGTETVDANDRQYFE